MAEREMFREPVTAIVLVLMTTSLLTCTVSSQPYKAIFKSEADSLAFNQLDTTVNVIPETIELGPEDSVGENFTIAVTVENVTDLAGLDIRISWNTSYLAHCSHMVTVSVEDYPNPVPPSSHPGILHDPTFGSITVNSTAGTLKAVYATFGPSFSGNGTVFVLTFNVINQPSFSEDDVTLSIQLTKTDLANTEGEAIPHVDFDATVTIHARENLHDIAITGITTSKTVIGQTYSMSINVTVENQGDYTEAFNVTLAANTAVIETVTNITLASVTNTTITFSWNTTGWMKGNYTIGAYATIVPYEKETADNDFIYGIVTVTIPGDVNCDFTVDIYDIVLLCYAYGSERGELRYDPNCDSEGDGDVDIYDVVIACGHYGETYP